MQQKPPRTARPAERRSAADRRPAVWPWVLMPLAALAMFFVPRTVRHSTQSGQLGPAVEVSGDTSAQ